MNHPSSSANALLRFATALADQLAVGGRVLDERHNNRRLELVHETRQVRRKGTTTAAHFPSHHASWLGFAIPKAPPLALEPAAA